MYYVLKKIPKIWSKEFWKKTPGNIQLSKFTVRIQLKIILHGHKAGKRMRVSWNSVSLSNQLKFTMMSLILHVLNKRIVHAEYQHSFYTTTHLSLNLWGKNVICAFCTFIVHLKFFYSVGQVPSCEFRSNTDPTNLSVIIKCSWRS